jgi:hypothetical protein
MAYTSEVWQLFTKGPYRRNISVFLITQNLFHQRRFCMDIALNAMCVNSVTDKNRFSHLARQEYPEDVAILYEAYLYASKNRTVTW